MRRYSVRQLTAELHRLVESRYPSLEVEGEVSQVATPASGHAYLTLRDEDAVLNCVCWRDTWRRQTFRPKRGDRIVARGRLGVYGGKGAYQLYIHVIERAGEGDLAKEIARRRARLEADGLLDPRRKRPLPPFPRVVGVATSLTGAALQDFLKVSRQRYPAARVLVAGCQVQGQHAAGSVVQAVDRLLEDGRSEVIVVTRGGGSKEDLMAFQDEGLARFLAHCPVPVVSAVGHQVDTTLADLVADAVAPTPTAAAVVALPDGPALTQRVDDASMALAASLERLLRRRRHEVDALRARLRHPRQRLLEVRRRAQQAETRLTRLLRSRLEAERSRLPPLEQRAAGAVARRLPAAHRDLARATEALRRAGPLAVSRRRERVERLVERAEALSPQRVLGRGYAVVTGPEGVLVDPAAAPAGTSLTLRLRDGALAATSDGPVEDA